MVIIILRDHRHLCSEPGLNDSCLITYLQGIEDGAEERADPHFRMLPPQLKRVRKLLLRLLDALEVRQMPLAHVACMVASAQCMCPIHGMFQCACMPCMLARAFGLASAAVGALLVQRKVC